MSTVIHKRPCPKCNGRMILIAGECCSIWRHPEAPPKDVVFAPLGAILLPPLEHIENRFQSVCENKRCQHGRQTVEAQPARVKGASSR